MEKRKHRIIISIAVIALVVLVITLNSTPERTFSGEYLVKSDFSDLGEDSRVYFEKNQDKLLVPIEMEEDGCILYYVESAKFGKAVLEKKTDDGQWEEVINSGRKRECYGLNVYVEKGTYRIKAGPYKDSVYLEYGTEYRNPPAVKKKDAELIKKDRFYAANCFTTTETGSHWYKFIVSEEEEQVLTIFSGRNWEKFEFRMKLYDENGNLLCNETLLDDLNPNEAPEKEIRRTFSPGVYYFEISKVRGKAGGGYGVSYCTE